MKQVAVALLFLVFSNFALATASEDFAAALDAMGKSDFKTAVPLFESGFKKIDHGDVVPEKDINSAKIGLATVYVAIGRVIEARDIAEPLLPVLKKNGPRDMYAGCTQVLFYVYSFLGDDKQAMAMLESLIPLQEELPKLFSNIVRAQTYSQQSFIHDRNGDSVNAIASQAKAIELYKASLPDSLNDLLSAYTALVDYSEKDGDQAGALQALQDKLALMVVDEKKFATDIYKTRIRIEAVKKRISQNGPDVDNPFGTDMQEMLARQTSVDIPTIQKNLLGIIETYGNESPLAALGWTGYADALVLGGETDYAFQAYDQAYVKLLNLYGNSSPNLAEFYLKIANARKQSVSFAFDLPEAQRKQMINEYNHAVNIYSDIYGDAHPLTISAIQALYEAERLQNDYALNFSIANRLFTAYSEYEKNSFTYLSRKQKLAFRKQYQDIGQSFIEASWLTQAKAPDESWFGNPYPDIDFSKPDWKADHDKKVALYENKQAQKKADKQRPLLSAFESWINHKGSINAIDNTLTLARQNTDNQEMIERIDEFFSAREQLANIDNKQEDWQQQQSTRKMLQARVTSLLKQLSLDIPELGKDSRVSLEELKAKIPKNAIYLDFVKLYTYQYAVFSYDANGEVRLIRLGDDAVTIEQRVQKVRNLINDTIDGNLSTSRSQRLLNKELAELYNKIIGQIPGVIEGYDELIISADGLLALMPMGLLYDEKQKQYLIEKYSIRSVPSARDLIKQKSHQQAATRQAVIFADPDFDLGIKGNKVSCQKAGSSRALTLSVLKNFDKPCIGRLPATAIEADSINTILDNKGKTYLQSHASETSLQLQQSPSILHIATHGFFLPDPAITNPLEKSGLILSGANAGIANKTGEGVITGLKLAGMNLKGTELVVLSACETGVGDIEQGEGVAGLNQAFLRAGAQGVVMSLWRVPDVQTAELMKRFYREIEKGTPSVEALRRAQRSFIEDGQHPLAWAAFAYSG